MDILNRVNSQSIAGVWLNDSSYQVKDQSQQLIVRLPPRINRYRQKFYLVQYGRHSHNLMYAIVTENELSIRVGSDPLSPNISINDGHQILPGKLLLMHYDKNYLYSEFEKLKMLCFSKGYDLDDDTIIVGPNTWLLVFYTCRKSNVVYAIINNQDTFKSIEVDYEDEEVYVNYGDKIYQAIIIKKSEDFEEILEAMTFIRYSCFNLQFPLMLDDDFEDNNIVPPPGFLSTCHIVKEIGKVMASKNEIDLEDGLARVERRMNNDQEMIFEFLNSLEYLKIEPNENQNKINGVADFSQLLNLPNEVEAEEIVNYLKSLNG